MSLIIYGSSTVPLPSYFVKSALLEIFMYSLADGTAIWSILNSKMSIPITSPIVANRLISNPIFLPTAAGSGPVTVRIAASSNGSASAWKEPARHRKPLSAICRHLTLLTFPTAM